MSFLFFGKSQPTFLIILFLVINRCPVLIRGTILNGAYGTDKNLYISLFLLTIFGPIYCCPPEYSCNVSGYPMVSDETKVCTRY